MTDTMTTKPNGKAIRFRKTAEKRVTQALDTIRRIGDLSNRSIYDYHQQQVVKVFETMRDELDAAEARFAPGRPNAGPVFTLD